MITTQEQLAKKLARYLTGEQWQNGLDLLLADVALKFMEEQSRSNVDFRRLITREGKGPDRRPRI